MFSFCWENRQEEGFPNVSHFNMRRFIGLTMCYTYQQRRVRDGLVSKLRIKKEIRIKHFCVGKETRARH